MPSNKLARTNDDIQLVMSKLLREIKDPRVNQGMISVTRVETTGDMRYCKIWLSVMGLQNEKEFKKGLKPDGSDASLAILSSFATLLNPCSRLTTASNTARILTS